MTQQLSLNDVDPKFAPKAPRKVSGLKGPIASFAIECLKGGWKHKEVLEMVKEKFPEAKTSLACIGWYSSKAKVREYLAGLPAETEVLEDVETPEAEEIAA